MRVGVYICSVDVAVHVNVHVDVCMCLCVCACVYVGEYEGGAYVANDVAAMVTARHGSPARLFARKGNISEGSGGQLVLVPASARTPH